MIFNPIYLLFIPFFGVWSAYQVGYGIITIMVFIITFSIFYLNRMKVYINHDAKVLMMLLCLPIMSVLFSDVYVYAFTSYKIELADLTEIIRPVYFFTCFLCVLAYVFHEKNPIRKTYRALIIVSILNLIVCLSPHIPLISNLSYLYSEGIIYSPGYSAYRATGIAGQPGKEGIISFLLIAIFYMLRKKYPETIKTNVVYIMTVINYICIVMTLSRTSLFITTAFLCYVFIKNYKLLCIGTIVLVLYAYIEREYFLYLIERIMRGGIGDGNLSTLGHRLVLKQWALDILSIRFDTVLFGIGDSKEDISRLTNSYASDLSLRQPDSSQTVWMLRYGMVGLLIHYAPFLYLLYRLINNGFYKCNLEIVITCFILFFSLFDPPFHEVKSQVIICFLMVVSLIKDDDKYANK